MLDVPAGRAAHPVAEAVYRSRHLLVKTAHRGDRCCVVTFDSYTDSADLDRDAFGEHFLAGQGVSAVHVVNGRNNWYHEPDWREAIEAARLQASRYPRIVTYGSSMGGTLRCGSPILSTRMLPSLCHRNTALILEKRLSRRAGMSIATTHGCVNYRVRCPAEGRPSSLMIR